MLIIEKLVANYVEKRLGKYVIGLDAHNFKIALFKGDVRLKDLELNPEGFTELPFPIILRQGKVGELALKIPWNNLGNKPIEVHVRDVLAVISIKKEWTLQNETDRLNEIKKQKLKAADLDEDLWAKVDEMDKQAVDKAKRPSNSGDKARVASAKGVSSDEDVKPKKASLAERMKHNFRLVIQNVHFRFEDDGFITGKPFAMGITLREITAETTDSKFQPCYVKAFAVPVHRRLIKFAEFAVYWNTELNPAQRTNRFASEAVLGAAPDRISSTHADMLNRGTVTSSANDTVSEQLLASAKAAVVPVATPLASEMPNSGLQQSAQQTSPLIGLDHEPMFVLCPVSGVVKLSTLLSKSDPEASRKHPQIAIDIDTPAIHVKLHRNQLTGILQFSGVVLNYQAWLVIRTNRPHRDPLHDPKSWWKYAYDAVRMEMERQSRGLFLSRHLRLLLNEYVSVRETVLRLKSLASGDTGLDLEQFLQAIPVDNSNSVRKLFHKSTRTLSSNDADGHLSQLKEELLAAVKRMHEIEAACPYEQIMTFRKIALLRFRNDKSWIFHDPDAPGSVTSDSADKGPVTAETPPSHKHAGVDGIGAAHKAHTQQFATLSKIWVRNVKKVSAKPGKAAFRMLSNVARVGKKPSKAATKAVAHFIKALPLLRNLQQHRDTEHIVEDTEVQAYLNNVHAVRDTTRVRCRAVAKDVSATIFLPVDVENGHPDPLETVFCVTKVELNYTLGMGPAFKFGLVLQHFKVTSDGQFQVIVSDSDHRGGAHAEQAVLVPTASAASTLPRSRFGVRHSLRGSANAEERQHESKMLVHFTVKCSTDNMIDLGLDMNPLDVVLDLDWVSRVTRFFNVPQSYRLSSSVGKAMKSFRALEAKTRDEIRALFGSRLSLNARAHISSMHFVIPQPRHGSEVLVVSLASMDVSSNNPSRMLRRSQGLRSQDSVIFSPPTSIAAASSSNPLLKSNDSHPRHFLAHKGRLASCVAQLLVELKDRDQDPSPQHKPFALAAARGVKDADKYEKFRIQCDNVAVGFLSSMPSRPVQEFETQNMRPLLRPMNLKLVVEHLVVPDDDLSSLRVSAESIQLDFYRFVLESFVGNLLKTMSDSRSSSPGQAAEASSTHSAASVSSASQARPPTETGGGKQRRAEINFGSFGVKLLGAVHSQLGTQWAMEFSNFRVELLKDSADDLTIVTWDNGLGHLDTKALHEDMVLVVSPWIDPLKEGMKDAYEGAVLLMQSKNSTIISRKARAESVQQYKDGLTVQDTDGLYMRIKINVCSLSMALYHTPVSQDIHDLSKPKVPLFEPFNFVVDHDLLMVDNNAIPKMRTCLAPTVIRSSVWSYKKLMSYHGYQWCKKILSCHIGTKNFLNFIFSNLKRGYVENPEPLGRYFAHAKVEALTLIGMREGPSGTRHPVVSVQLAVTGNRFDTRRQGSLPYSMDIAGTLSIDLMNPKNGAFEPVLEPWQFTYKQFRTLGADGVVVMQAGLDSKQVMNVNLVMEDLFFFRSYWYFPSQNFAEYKPPFDRVGTEFLAQNQSGAPLTVFSVEAGLDQFDGEQSKLSSQGPDAVCGLAFPVLFRAELDDESSRASRTAVVEMDGLQYAVPMDCPGSYVASLADSESVKSSPNVAALVMDVLVDECHMLRIRSPVTFKNDTDVPVQVVLTSSQDAPSNDTLSHTIVLPRDQYVVPVTHTNASFAWLRPSAEYGWPPSGVQLKQQGPIMELAVSRHLSDSSKTFAFAIELVLQERYNTWGKECPAPPPAIVTILPPLIIQNLLPLSAEVGIYREAIEPRSPNHDNSGSAMKTSTASESSRDAMLRPGDSVHVHEVVPASQAISLNAALRTSDGAKSAWSERFGIGSGSDCARDLQVLGLSKPMRFEATCSWKCCGQPTEGGSTAARVLVQLHSSVWLVNNTSVDLWARVGANQQWVLLNADLQSPLLSHVSPSDAQEVELSFGLPGIHAVKVPLKKTHPRDRISLYEHASSGMWNGKGLIQLRMAVNPCPGDFSLTRLVALYPALAVANGSRLLEFRLRQSDTSLMTEMVLAPGQTRPWVWPDSTKPLDLAVKLVDGNWSWSSPVPYDTDGDHYCFVANDPNSPARRALLKYENKANKGASGGTFVVLIRKVTLFEAPIRVVNLLSHPVTMQQHGVAASHLLPPFATYPYAWDNLQSPSLDLVFLLSTGDGSHEKVIVDPSTLETHCTLSGISIVITTEKQFKVITISPPPSTAPSISPPPEPSVTSRNGPAVPNKRLIFAVRLPMGVMITLIDTHPQEILAVSLSDLNFEMLGHNKDVQMSLNVGDIQLDNQARHPGMPPYPVLVCRRGGPRPVLVPKPMLSLTLLRTENIDKYTLHFKQLLLKVQDLDVSIDSAIAARVYEMYKLYFSPAKYADYDSALLGADFIQHIFSPPESWGVSGSTKHRMLWDHVEVDAIEAAVTFAVYPVDLNADSRSSGSFARRFRRGLAGALVNVYRAPINLHAVIVRHQQISLSQLGHLLRDQYKVEFLRAPNILAILASVGIIGAPASTVASIAEGFEDLYSGLCILPLLRSSPRGIPRPRLRPRQGSVFRSKRLQSVMVSAPLLRQNSGLLSDVDPSASRLSFAARGCTSFSAHLVDALLGIVGNVTKSLGKGLRGLTIDPTQSNAYGEHERVARRPQNFIEGTVLASRMIYGDLCVPSQREACHPRAVMAFVIRPVSTALTAFSQITDGIQSSARQLTGVYDTRPIRPPRLLLQSQVSDYNFELALAADLDRNCFPSLNLTPVALCHTLRGYFVVTYAHILTYYQSMVGLSRGVTINVSEIVSYELWRGPLVKSQVGVSFCLSPSSRTIDRHPIIRFASLADAALALTLAEPILSRRPYWVPTETAKPSLSKMSKKSKKKSRR